MRVCKCNTLHGALPRTKRCYTTVLPCSLVHKNTAVYWLHEALLRKTKTTYPSLSIISCLAEVLRSIITLDTQIDLPVRYE